MLNPYAIGKTIYLRSPEQSDLESRWYEWFSDPRITCFLGDRYWPNTKDLQATFLASALSATDRLVLMICTTETDELIGVCNLNAINWVSRHADIAVVIGESGNKYAFSAGLEAIKLLVEIAFLRLNLENLRATHYSTHPYTPLLVRLFGFDEVGRLKKFSNFKGELIDSVICQLSRDSWKKRNSKSV
jgi:RimJ/RimL family protein N-acetyltransferase